VLQTSEFFEHEAGACPHFETMPRIMTRPFPQEHLDQDLTTAESTGPDWRWHGLLARGNVTLLTDRWNTGKTTLLSLMLCRRKRPDLSGALGRK
jgi:hypothetical protein